MTGAAEGRSRRTEPRPPTDADGVPVPVLAGPDWRWRRRIREKPATYRIYRLVIGTIGAVVVVGGLFLVPLPGPGWLIVFFGVAIWATEFTWAQRLLAFGTRTLRRWETWLRDQGRLVQGAVAVATFLFVAAVVWVTLRLTGVPGFVPEGAAAWLRTTLHL